jgi:hypothetical protein
LTLASRDGGTREAVEQIETRLLAVVDENRMLKVCEKILSTEHYHITTGI